MMYEVVSSLPNDLRLCVCRLHAAIETSSSSERREEELQDGRTLGGSPQESRRRVAAPRADKRCCLDTALTLSPECEDVSCPNNSSTESSIEMPILLQLKQTQHRS